MEEMAEYVKEEFRKVSVPKIKIAEQTSPRQFYRNYWKKAGSSMRADPVTSPTHPLNPDEYRKAVEEVVDDLYQEKKLKPISGLEVKPIPLDIEIPTDIPPDVFGLTSVLCGLMDSAIEYGLGRGYKELTGEDWFVYNDPMVYTSKYAFLGYSFVHGVALKMSSEHLREMGYESVKDVPLKEWLNMGIAYGLGASANEFILGAIMDKVFGYKWFEYDSPLKYTSVKSIPVWGISGVLGSIFSMWLAEYIKKKRSEIKELPMPQFAQLEAKYE